MKSSSVLLALCLATASMASLAAPIQMSQSEMASVVAGAKWKVYDTTTTTTFDPAGNSSNTFTTTTTTTLYSTGSNGSGQTDSTSTTTRTKLQN